MEQNKVATNKPTDEEVATSIMRLAAGSDSIPDPEVRAVVRRVMDKVSVLKGESDEAAA